MEDLSQQEGLFTLFDVQHDFPNEWYKATQMPVAAGTPTRTLSLASLADRLPVYTRGRKVTAVDIIMMTSATMKIADLNLNSDATDNAFQAGVNIPPNYNAYAIHDVGLTINSWTLTVTNTPLSDMWLIVRYTLK